MFGDMVTEEKSKKARGLLARNSGYLYISLLVEGHSCDSSVVAALQDGDGVECGGVPYTNERLLPNLSCCYQVLV